MDEKITIIEGPPPSFERAGEAWALGLNESPQLTGIAVTRLRTFNGPALVERCYRAWHSQGVIHLEYRGLDGLANQAPILAARTVQVADGELLVLWVKVENLEEEPDFPDEDDFEDDQDASL